MKPKSKPVTGASLIKSLGIPKDTQVLINSIPVKPSAPIQFGARITIRYTANTN